jgi:seryl-tRNA(Sec) selenium transferase
LYLEGRHREIPVWRYLARTEEEVQSLAQLLAASCGGVVEPGTTEVGGGSMPGAVVPTWRVGVRTANPQDLAALLRTKPVPVVGYVQDGTFWLDPRTAEKREVEVASSYLAG